MCFLDTNDELAKFEMDWIGEIAKTEIVLTASESKVELEVLEKRFVELLRITGQPNPVKECEVHFDLFRKTNLEIVANRHYYRSGNWKTRFRANVMKKQHDERCTCTKDGSCKNCKCSKGERGCTRMCDCKPWTCKNRYPFQSVDELMDKEEARVKQCY